MTDRQDAELERRYAQAERKLDAYYDKRRRRGPPILLGTLLALTLAVGVVAAVDLRRLQTPRGTALAWTGATVFGDCTAYLDLSVPDVGVTEPRSDEQLCASLRQRSAASRAAAAQIGIDLVEVRQEGDRATAVLSVRRPGRDDQVTLLLRREGRGWAVLRTPAVCLALGCA